MKNLYKAFGSFSAVIMLPLVNLWAPVMPAEEGSGVAKFVDESL